MYFVYILKSRFHNKFYTGCTDNIDKRLIQHNKGYSFYTKKYLPWRVYYIEKYDDKYEAYAREKYLKSHAGRNWIKKNLIH